MSGTRLARACLVSTLPALSSLRRIPLLRPLTVPEAAVVHVITVGMVRFDLHGHQRTC